MRNVVYQTMPVYSEKFDTVTLVTLERPQVRNAVDTATAHALHAAFVAFEHDDTANVAVFHGAGGHFCAGWDLQAGAELLAQGLAPEALAQQLDFSRADAESVAPMGPTRLALSKPVVAAISGAAVAEPEAPSLTIAATAWFWFHEIIQACVRGGTALPYSAVPVLAPCIGR